MIEELLYGRTRSFLIGRKILINTDWTGSLLVFFACLKGRRINIKNIQYLLITHYHPDHMGIAADLMEMGVALLIMDVQKDFVHQSDAVFKKERRHRFTPVDERKAIFLNCSDSRNFLSQIGISGEIIPTPGHSDDSVSLILDEEQAAFVGDFCPFEQVPYCQNRVLEESASRLKSMGVKKIYYSHYPSEDI